MRRLAVGAALVLSACSGRGEIIPTPSSAPDSPATTEGVSTTVLTAVEELVTTTTEAVAEPTVPVRSVPRERTPTPTHTSTRSTSSTLASIRACESGGNYTIDTGNGYYGAYQFSLSTWQSVGGSGNPANASPAEQDMRAQMMIDAGRRGEWPNC